MTWDYLLLEGTSQDFCDLGLQECSYVTRGDIPGSPRNIPGLLVTWDHRSVAMLLEGTSQEVPGTSQDFRDLGLS